MPADLVHKQVHKNLPNGRKFPELKSQRPNYLIESKQEDRGEHGLWLHPTIGVKHSRSTTDTHKPRRAREVALEDFAFRPAIRLAAVL